MDISLKRENYKFLNKLAENTLEETVECDISLPEYMPEILRVVRTIVTPNVNSCRLSGDRVTVDGTCRVRIIYTAEDGGLYSYTHTQPFTKYCEGEALSESVDVTAKASVSFVNCRATNNRRAEIKAGISVRVYVYGEECNNLIVSAEADGLEQKLVQIDAMSLGCRKTKHFSMSDTISIKEAASHILSVQSSAVCTDIRKINNKMMIRGEALVRVCYVRDSDRGASDVVKHTIPINQIIEFEGMDERFTGNVVLDVCSVDLIPKGEGSGGLSELDVSLGVDVTATMWDLKTLSIISDAYCVGSSLELKRAAHKYYVALREIRDTLIAEDSFSMPADGVSCIHDCGGEIISRRFKCDDGKSTITGSINVTMLVKDGNGSFNTLVKTLDYCYPLSLENDTEPLYCEPSVTLIDLDCAISSGNISVRAELSVTGTVFREQMIDTVTDMTESDRPSNNKRYAVTVYFPEAEESLWSIARRYNTTVSAIADENNLSGDTTEDLKILFIPAV